MHLHENDVVKMLSSIPCLALATQAGARRYVGAMVRDGTELEAVLARYPTVKYEPLDPHYVLLSCLGGLSEELISDLCTHHAWRGIVSAAFLVTLAPDMRYRKHLVAAGGRAPRSQWLVELALAEVDHVIWPVDTELQGLIHQLRSMLTRLPRPGYVLRPALNNRELGQVEAEREKVRSAYRSGGLHAASREIDQSEVLVSLLTRR